MTDDRSGGSAATSAAEAAISGEIRFVPAREGDAATVVELRRRIWQTTYRGIYPDDMLDAFDRAWHMKKEIQRIRNPKYAVHLIVYDGESIGYLTMRNADDMILQSLYVLDAYQQRGIGRRAFEFAAAYCRERGVDSFICECVPENGKARAFYERMGGVVIGEDLANEESWQNAVTYQFKL